MENNANLIKCGLRGAGCVEVPTCKMGEEGGESLRNLHTRRHHVHPYVIKVTRCSAIAERPHYRLRYSFRRK